MPKTKLERHGAKIYLDFDMMDWLRKKSEERRIPWVQIIRELLMEAMNKDQKPKTP